MVKGYYVVKRSWSETSVYLGTRKIGSLPTQAVIELETSDGTCLVRVSDMRDADIVAIMLEQSDFDE